MVQQLGLCASTAGDTGLIPSWETKILKLQTAKTEKKKKKNLSNLYSTKKLPNHDQRAIEGSFSLKIKTGSSIFNILLYIILSELKTTQKL